MSAPKESPSLVPVPRVIPGLSSSNSTSTAPKPRKRHSKKSVLRPESPSVGPQLTGTVEPVTEEQSVQPLAADQDDLIKKTSATEQVKKRLRAQNKKLQRLDAYEAKSDINEDQRRALAGRGTIDAVVKELNELLVILQAEEAEDVAREERVAVADEKKQSRAVEAAVEASKAEAQSQLVLLFQFLRLRSLYAPNEPSAFAPASLPPVVAQATGQEVAAVHMLFDAMSNGPLLGGNGDALEKLGKIASGSEETVLEEVTFSRIQELIRGLTAPPPSVQIDETPLDSPVLESSAPPGPSDSVCALVDGEKEESHAAPSFLNESELEPPAQPEEMVATWAGEIADSAHAPPPSGPATPSAEIGAFNGVSTPSTEVPSPALATSSSIEEPLSAATPPAVVPQQEQTLDWSAEDDGAGELPQLPELAPAVPVVGGGQAQQQQAGDGFQTARPPRQGGPRGGYRGRGGPRGGFNGDGSRRGSYNNGGGAPRGSYQGGGGRGDGRGRGGGRGGRGGGERGGRGRGGPNGSAPAPTPATPSA